ncbi:class I SAM-dependent methyltransferase [Auritidibacter ignavus]|uniref:class I SAM-dependent methyltransferase n=1 Tax=Auritidibacter ignavus TaxID=678932 RepID=UPI000D73B759|nr:class I SAM-dependent methyltransferase [Auritidibacter ignavus]PXA82323.1 hypothetical protein DCC26_00740 [Auritidibacter sp. NML120779]WHS27068.1 class I SAM-dependent methyltransferase [Auritidibacter ignavus]
MKPPYPDESIETYELVHSVQNDVNLISDFVSSLPRMPVTVLEFGAGTGRLTLPLAEAGFSITALDLSPTMLEILQRRTRGYDVSTACGDFRNELVHGIFDLCVIVTNTLFMVPGWKEQQRVLSQAANCTADNGYLILETYDPRIYLDQPETFSLSVPLTEQHLLTDTAFVDHVAEKVTLIRTVTGPENQSFYTETSHWLAPRELDILASSVGFELLERYEDLAKNPYVTQSKNLVSVYQKTCQGEER